MVSTPEPGLALLDAGKRVVPYDLDLPVPLALLDADGTRHPLGTSTTDARIDAVNDQHAFLRTDPAVPVALGDRVLLGLSHPCMMFDKGRLLPVVADLDDADPLIVGLIETRFGTRSADPGPARCRQGQPRRAYGASAVTATTMTRATSASPP